LEKAIENIYLTGNILEKKKTKNILDVQRIDTDI